MSLIGQPQKASLTVSALEQAKIKDRDANLMKLDRLSGEVSKLSNTCKPWKNEFSN